MTVSDSSKDQIAVSCSKMEKHKGEVDRWCGVGCAQRVAKTWEGHRVPDNCRGRGVRSR